MHLSASFILRLFVNHHENCIFFFSFLLHDKMEVEKVPCFFMKVTQTSFAHSQMLFLRYTLRFQYICSFFCIGFETTHCEVHAFFIVLIRSIIRLFGVSF
jgi:hypothetical protein